MKPNQTEDMAEVVSPRQARRQFLTQKRGTVKQSTVRAYKFPTKHFVEFCEEHDVETMSGVNGYVIESWKQQRKSEEIKPITLHNNAKHLRVYTRWAESSDLVEYGLADHMDIPDVPEGDDVSSDVLRLGQAEELLRYLQTYEYASRKHALFYTMWHTGCRISGAIALDVDDLNKGDDGLPILRFRNRKATGTALKNGNSGERNVSIDDSLHGVLNDYLEAKREPVTDDYGREPLFTTASQRLTRQRAYKDFTALTRPCVSSGECSHDKDIDSCEAAQQKKKAFGCPSSPSLHPIRRGSITYQVNRGFPKEKLSERVDVSVDVLSKHYDARTQEQERQGRKEYLDLL